MRLLVLHLSDLHFDAIGSNPAVYRAADIASAALGSIPGCTHALVVITGDIVDKGNSAAYGWAEEFINDLMSSLQAFDSGLMAVDFLVIPGNHDVERPASTVDAFPWTAARADLLKAPTSPAPAEGPLAYRVKQQDQFYEFVEKTPSEGLWRHSKLSAIRTFDYPELPVSVLCINTTLLCESDSDQGSLLAWLGNTLDKENRNELRIVAMHHPFAWLQRDNARLLEREIQEYGDIVLSGHEHTSDSFVKHRAGTAENAFFEGDSLSGPSGGFAAIVFDTETQARRTYPFVWQGQGYIEYSTKGWVPMRRGIGGPADGFFLDREFEEWLDDPGENAPQARHITLEDIFVYPRLRDMTLEVKQGMRSGPQPSARRETSARDVAASSTVEPRKPEASLGLVRGAADVVGRIEADTKILVLGEARSGKSTLLRKWFRDLRGKGFVPLLIKPGDCRNPSADNIHAALQRRAVEQYGEGANERFLRLPLSKRVILLDELQSLDFSNAQLKELFDSLATVTERTIIAGDELYLLRQIFAAAQAVEMLDFKIYRLLELDSRQQRDLMAKTHQALTSTPEDQIPDSLNQLESSMVAVLGEHMVTPFAGEVREIVRQFVLHPHGTGSHGAFGFYYDTQIKADITAGLGACPKDVLEPQADAIEAFLSSLASHLHKKGSYNASESDLDLIIEDYRANKIPIEKAALLAILRASRLLVSKDGQYYFRERYQRYYFLARHIQKLLGDDATVPEARTLLEGFVNRIHERECADVVLFTIYLTSSTWLLERLAERANSIFEGLAECDMDAHFAFAEGPLDDLKLRGNSPPQDFETGTPDGSPARQPASGEGELEVLLTDTLRTMSESFNVLNILGLAVRNYPARIDLPLREQIVVNAYRLGLRSLSAFLDLIQEGSSELAILTRRHLKLDAAIADPSALSSHLVSLCSFGVVRRLVTAFASPHLEMLLTDIWGSDERISAKMIRTGTLLPLRKIGEHDVKQFASELAERGNAHVVLMYVVGSYLRTFRSSRERRIALCQAVGLDPENPAFFYNPERPKALSPRG